MPNSPESASHFTIGRSLRLRLAINGLHVLSILASWLNDLPIFLNLLLSAVVMASWFFQYKACEADSIYLRYTLNDGWAVSFSADNYLAVKIKPTTVVARMLIVLHLHADNRSKTLVIFNDAMTAHDYRRLTVLLKISG